MSDLTNIEKRNLERLFGMSSGYVLDFSNRTFEEFIFDSVGISILTRSTITGVDRRQIVSALSGV